MKRELQKLLKLVMRWDGTVNEQRKAQIQKQIARANDRFHARWQRDGLVVLLESSEGKP